MMCALLFALLFCFYDPSTANGAIVSHVAVDLISGVTGQQEQPASFRVSKVTIEGASAFSADQIRSLAKLKVGQVVNERTIAKVREAILGAYANRGRIKARLGVQPDFKPANPGAKLGDVDIRIEIDEGAVFVLRRLEFVGNETTRDRIVRRRVLQQEGEPYSQELMGKSLNRLNALGRFENLTMADVEIRVDEKERIVDLLFHLKEIKRSQTRR